jgi:hypothetical protein
MEEYASALPEFLKRVPNVFALQLELQGEDAPHVS